MKEYEANRLTLKSLEKPSTVESNDLDIPNSPIINDSKDEKDYQKLINEKLKSAADWDFRDSRFFSIG